MTTRTAIELLVSMLALCAGGAHAADPAVVASMHEHKCYVCHADNVPLAGPAFADVAACYRDNVEAAAILSTIIRAGARDGGPWHMPPHPELSAKEATAIARYILSLDRVPPEGIACSLPRQPATTTSPRS